MLPHALLGLLVLLGFAGRPWWVVLVAASALTIASLDYVQARARDLSRIAESPTHLKSLAINAGDSLAYSALAYLAGWLLASIIGFA
jgi:hypothetical protein